MTAQPKYEVHSAAECVRLMTDDELSALAADIAENGQADPVTLGKINGHVATWLVDGRNRVKACELAGVEPVYETREFKDDDEIKAFVNSKSERRDLTKGQKAMRVALLYPEPEVGGRGKKSKNSKETLGFTIMRLSQARAVLAHSRDLALEVRDGLTTLDDALEKVKGARQARETVEAKMARLSANAPDLADLVSEDRMKIDEAIAALAERERKTRQIIEAGQQAAVRLVPDFLANVAAIAAAAQFGGTVEPQKLDGIIEAATNLKTLLAVESGK
jgi:hypothetical protein